MLKTKKLKREDIIDKRKTRRDETETETETET